MPAIHRLIGVMFFLMAAAASASGAVTIIGYSPSVRNGGFETDDYGNAGGPNGQWRDSSGQNRITNADDIDFPTTGLGPTSASSGTYFGYTLANSSGDVQLFNPFPQNLGEAPLPANNITSFDLDFDLAGSGTFNVSRTNFSVRLWNLDESLQQGYGDNLTPDLTPTTWQHVHFHQDGPFFNDDLSASFDDVGKFKLTFQARTTAGSGYIFVDNVQLVLNEAAVPEPASIGLLGLTAISLVMRRRAMKLI